MPNAAPGVQLCQARLWDAVTAPAREHRARLFVAQTALSAVSPTVSRQEWGVGFGCEWVCGLRADGAASRECNLRHGGLGSLRYERLDIDP